MTPRAASTLISLGLVLGALAGQWPLGDGAKNVAGGSAISDAATVSFVGIAPSAVVGDVVGHRPKVATGLVDYHGNETTVACATCHATREPDRSNGAGGKTPQAFHQGLVYAHGGQSCLSCHNSEDYDSLRLADGRKLGFADSQQLCAQCHGPQTRDYQHGSHGGMRGYWDKTKGERTRNTCLDCHDPHAPAYPAWTPVFPPRDAAARQQAEREAAHAKLMADIQTAAAGTRPPTHPH